ncbi:hypothetical protein COCNU_scaffold019103G000030 [Cocos nucifera]|nr:hypothetical protein [Cocos nucifera]
MRSDKANLIAEVERFSEITISENATQRTEPLRRESKNEQMVSLTHKGDNPTPQKETERTDAQLLSGDLEDEGSSLGVSMLVQPIQRPGNQISSSNQDKRNNEQPHQQQSMRSDKANLIAEVERFSEITISENATQRTEPLRRESKNEQMVSLTHKGDNPTPQKETERTDAQLLSGDLEDEECPICFEDEPDMIITTMPNDKYEHTTNNL